MSDVCSNCNCIGHDVSHCKKTRTTFDHENQGVNERQNPT
jgi:hypothetical protein